MSISNNKNQRSNNTILLSMTASGLAELITVPIDTVKVHMQAHVNRQTSVHTTAKNPMIRSMVEIFKVDGLGGFYKSSMASVTKGMCSGGIRIGLYDYLNLSWKKDTYNTPAKVAANITQGAICGVVSSSVSMPFDLVKTRVQAVQGTSQAKNVGEMIKHVLKEQGILGFYRGYRQTVERSVLISVIQMPVYFTMQQTLDQFRDILGLNTRATIATLAAIVTTTAIVYPLDLVKTQIQYTGKTMGTIDMVKHIIKTTGPRSLYRGCSVGFARAFPLFWLTSIFYENLKQL